MGLITKKGQDRWQDWLILIAACNIAAWVIIFAVLAVLHVTDL